MIIECCKLHTPLGLDTYGYSLRGGATANVKEVSGVTAMQLNNVHSRHGQPGAVHHASNGTCNLTIATLSVASCYITTLSSLFIIKC